MSRGALARQSNGWSRSVGAAARACLRRPSTSIRASSYRSAIRYQEQGRRTMEMEMPERLPERLPERRRTPWAITPSSEPGVDGAGSVRFPLNHDALNSLVQSALHEDGALNDLTTIATVVSERRARAKLVARDSGV